MTWGVHAALLVAAATALWTAGLRLGSAAGTAGLVRLLFAAPVAVSAAGAWGLALGLVGGGGSPVALTLAAVATWAVVRVISPGPAQSPWPELARWWGRLTLPGRALAGGVAGALAGWAAWLLKHPVVGGDGLLYHLPKVAVWAQGGRPGGEATLFVDNPFGAYPGTNELILAWAGNIARSMAPLTLWMVPLMVALLAGSMWVLLRTFAAPVAASAGLAAAVVSGPLLVTQASGPNTDLPALAWLACAAALAAVAVHDRRPGVLPAVVLAAALAVGTKSTTAPLAVAVLLVAGLGLGRSALTVRRGLALAVIVGAAVGGLWYLRNIVRHGSPLWPFVALPGGDDVPPALSLIDGRAIADPGAAIAGRLDVWADRLAGQLLLLGAALLAPAVARTRAVTAAWAATVASLVLWALAPATGFPEAAVYDNVAASALRYLTPALVPAALTLALVACASKRLTVAVTVLSAVAVAWNLVENASIGFPFVPGPSVLVAAGAGVVAAVLLARVRRPTRVPPAAAATAAAALAAAVVVAAAGPGYVARHLDTGPASAGLVRAMAAQPGFTDGDRPVAMAAHLEGMLAGRRLSHRLELVGLAETCARIRTRARAGYVLVDTVRATIGVPELDRLETPSTRQPARVARCLAASTPLAAVGPWLVFGPQRGP